MPTRPGAMRRPYDSSSGVPAAVLVASMPVAAASILSEPSCWNTQSNR